MTKVPGLATVIWFLLPPLIARAVKRQLYDVQASSGVGTTKLVSGGWNSTSSCPFFVLMIDNVYRHGPGGSVMPGLLQTNRGCRVNNTSMLRRVGLVSRSHERTLKDRRSWRIPCPWPSISRARKKTAACSGKSESARTDRGRTELALMMIVARN